MKRYTVYGSVTIGVTMTVEASSEDEAIEVAERDWPGLSNYCGNGGTNQLVGVYDASVSLDSGWSDCPEFTEAEEA